MSTPTYQEAKTLLRKRQKCQWKRATGDYNPSTDPINRLARQSRPLYSCCKQDTVACDMKRTGIVDYALCNCKETEQMVRHILQDCPIWRKQRHQLRPQNESTTKLWGTVEDLCRATICWSVQAHPNLLA